MRREIHMRHAFAIVLLSGTCTTIATADTWQFQSETVAWADMTRADLALDLVQRSIEGDGHHVLIRFDEPVSTDDRLRLKASGLTVLNPLGGSSYMARINGGELDPAGLLQQVSIQEVRDIDPMWKLHRWLAAGNVPTWGISQTQSRQANPTIPIYIMLHRDVDLAGAELDVKAMMGGHITSTLTSINTIVAEVPYDTIWTLIEDDRVLYLEPALPAFTITNNSNRDITQANDAQAAPYDLDGDGVSVMVYDGGKAYTHGDFGGRLTPRDSSSTSNHATHVSGTIGGDGSGSGGDYRGMAPAVTIESYGFEQEGGLSEGFLYTDPGDLEEDYGNAINTYGCVLANNSIGTNTASNGFPCEWTGDYGVTSNLIDHVARGGLGGDIRIVWANGNERQTSNCGSNFNTTAPPACAKNHITVGALNSNDDSVTSFTSWGPTDDHRIKPDISAPGCQSNDDNGVTSCSSSGGYTTMCGTSMASPTVCGLSALILQDHRALHPGEPDIAGHTLKSLLAHTAYDGGNTGPDNKYGYGSVRVQDAIDHMRAGNFAEKTIDQGQTIEVLIFVEQGQSTVKATIAWNDVPATPLVIPSLVNDINLTIIDPNGATHWPWTLIPGDPGAPAVRTGPDHINNIEQVQIDNAVPGVYRVVITGTNIAEGPQDFGLQASPLLVNCSSAGHPSLSGSRVPCGATIGLRVVDCDLDTDPEIIDTVQVTVEASSGDAIDVTLVETGSGTAAFTADITLGVDLIADEGDTVNLIYIDADDGSGGINMPVTATTVVDCTPALVTSVSISDIGPFTAVTNVTTDEDARVEVFFGTSCASANNVADGGGFDTSHAVNLSGLNEDTDWYVKVRATDRAGNVSEFDNGGSCWSFHTTDIPNYFTELFSGFDLDGKSLILTPNGSQEGYDACLEDIVELPTDPGTGSSVSLSDDDSEFRSTGQDVYLYGIAWDGLYVCSNGQVTFGAGTGDYSETLSEHFSRTEIAMLWDDLNPASGGAVRFGNLSDRAVVTFDGVPQYSNNDSNTFQLELFYDGTLRLSWLGIGSSDSIVGLSHGDGTPDGFIQSDFTTLPGCEEVLVGDVNGDGIVNVQDLLMIISAFGSCPDCPEDLDGDGLAGASDILIVLANWGMTG